MAFQPPHDSPSQDELQLPASTVPPSTAHPVKQKSWVIFGATGHIGRSLTRNVLGHGDRVLAVGRVGENSLEQMRGWHVNCLGVLCDVRIRSTIQEVFDQALAKLGGIDVIVK